MSLGKEFKEFAMKGNVIDMAVGVIIGAAFGKIVTSLVEDVIMPPLGKVIGGVNFTDLAVSLGMDPAGKEVLWKYGNFLQITFQFLIVAFVLFMVIRTINKLKKPDPAAPPPRAAAPGSAAARNPRPAREEVAEHCRSMAAVRYTWMFRTAAVVFLLLGLSWLWRIRAHRLPTRRSGRRGLALGLLALIVGVFLFQRAKWAIALSALVAVVVAVGAVLFVAAGRAGPESCSCWG